MLKDIGSSEKEAVPDEQGSSTFRVWLGSTIFIRSCGHTSMCHTHCCGLSFNTVEFMFIVAATKQTLQYHIWKWFTMGAALDFEVCFTCCGVTAG